MIVAVPEISTLLSKDRACTTSATTAKRKIQLMVLEIVTARIRSEMLDEFPLAFLKARAYLSSNPHVLSFKLMRGIEDAATFVLLIEWDSVAGHMEIFRKSQDYSEFRAILGPFYEAIEMKHYESALYAKTP